ncbi:MAG: LytR C-terminal domain-containing protein [FCB group bacterium]|nr:LytR C-terminal domain-containing protein [FCB group bacterium]
MTTRRTGKSSSKPASKTRNDGGRLNLIIVLLVVQICLLALVLLNQYEILPLETQKPIASENTRVEPPLTVVIPPPEEDISPAEIPDPLRVEILNGCGVKGLAGKTANFLRRKGYDVRDFRNADNQNVEHTAILVRSGDRSHGEELASTIALPLEMILMEEDPGLVDVDVSLILGEDYKKYVLPQ